MLGRRHSSSLSSMDAQYHTLPQSPKAAHDVNIPSAIEEADMIVEEAFEDPIEEDPTISEVPVDSKIKWIHFMLGSAVLIPWNVMITAEPYFLSQLQSSSMRSTFGSYLATSFTLSNFIFLAHATITSKEAPSAQRGRWAMLCLASLICVLFFSTFFTLPTSLFGPFVLMIGITLAACGSYLQTSVVAVASLFGPSIMQAVMSGQAVVAVILSLIQLLSAFTSLHASEVSPTTDGSAETKSARLFFGMSALFLFACGFANVWMTRMPAYRAVVVPIDESWMRRRLSVGADHRPLLASELTTPEAKGIMNRVLSVARRNIVYEVAAGYVFIITLSVFPAITISIGPTNPGIHPLFFSSLHFVVFNCGDWFGRYLCSIPRLLVWSSHRLLGLSLSRTLFIPLFLACNLQRDSFAPSKPPVVSSDVMFMVLLFAFGVTNGYVSSMCMMSAPSLEHNPRLKGRKEDVDLAAPIASFCIVGGLVIGSIFSFIVRAIVCGCNPFQEA
ncbi:nucleoside transporter-domain-containing protein [Gloeopeniophorella convolvens]|nr:nucleoside transporter-domain-containing protein [Gloeopeniophorella convolvens]